MLWSHWWPPFDWTMLTVIKEANKWKLCLPVTPICIRHSLRFTTFADWGLEAGKHDRCGQWDKKASCKMVRRMKLVRRCASSVRMSLPGRLLGAWHFMTLTDEALSSSTANCYYPGYTSNWLLNKYATGSSLLQSTTSYWQSNCKDKYN